MKKPTPQTIHGLSARFQNQLKQRAAARGMIVEFAVDGVTFVSTTDASRRITIANEEIKKLDPNQLLLGD